MYIFTHALLSPFLNKLASYDFYHQECECRIPVSYKIYNHTNKVPHLLKKYLDLYLMKGHTQREEGDVLLPPNQASLGEGVYQPLKQNLRGWSCTNFLLPPNHASLGEGVYQPLKQILGGLMCTNFLLHQIKLAWGRGMYQPPPQNLGGLMCTNFLLPPNQASLGGGGVSNKTSEDG